MINHGIWKVYVPEPYPEGLPPKVMFWKNEQDVDWYDYRTNTWLTEIENPKPSEGKYEDITGTIKTTIVGGTVSQCDENIFNLSLPGSDGAEFLLLEVEEGDDVPKVGERMVETDGTITFEDIRTNSPESIDPRGQIIQGAFTIDSNGYVYGVDNAKNVAGVFELDIGMYMIMFDITLPDNKYIPNIQYLTPGVRMDLEWEKYPDMLIVYVYDRETQQLGRPCELTLTINR